MVRAICDGRLGARGAWTRFALTSASISGLRRTSTGHMVPPPRSSILGRKVLLLTALVALGCSNKNSDAPASGSTDDGGPPRSPPASNFGFSPVDAQPPPSGAGGGLGASG